MAIAATYLERSSGGPRNVVTLFDVHGRRGAAPTPRSTPAASTCRSRRWRAGRSSRSRAWRRAAGDRSGRGHDLLRPRVPGGRRVLALGGAELILVPNACELEANRLGQMRARAFENMVAVAVANYAAPQENGHSTVVDPIAFDAEGREPRHARLRGRARPEEVHVVRLDLEALREWRRREVWGGQCRRPETYGALVEERRRAAAETVRTAGRPSTSGGARPADLSGHVAPCHRRTTAGAVAPALRAAGPPRPLDSAHVTAHAAAPAGAASVVEVARGALVAVQRLRLLDDLLVGPVGGVLDAPDLGAEVVGPGGEDRLDGERRRVPRR